MNQSYAAILSRSASIAVKKSKEAKVLEELQNRTDLTQKEIAKKVGCCEVYVSKIKKAKMMDAQPTWYEKHMSRAKEFDPSRLVLDRPIACTSNLYPDVPQTASQGHYGKGAVRVHVEYQRRSEGSKKHTKFA
jgi:hypothetical protein